MVSLFLGAVQSAQEHCDRSLFAVSRWQPQVARDDRAFEINLDALGWWREQGRTLPIEINFSSQREQLLFRAVEPQKLGEVPTDGCLEIVLTGRDQVARRLGLLGLGFVFVAKARELRPPVFPRTDRGS